MWRKVLLLSAVAVVLLAFRAPLRQGKGGFMDGLIREKIGKVGAAGKWIEHSLREQFVNKRVHYRRAEHSWSGRVVDVAMQPASADRERTILVTVATMKGMGDKIKTGEGEEDTVEKDYGASAIILLDQISGIMKEAHPYVGSSIKVSYDDYRSNILLPSSPSGMFIAGAANVIVAVYSDYYLEVDVTGMALATDPNTEIASGTVFIHIEDIIRDENLQIVPRLDPETYTRDD